ncbi:HAD-IA family hydrolase [Ruminococcaceae bacterium OttesenSCG-928-L11]|nr:HAD-IA family hydrolase [Ruminococcaceae bacterium OttesenSCG-928-L11]
MQYAIFDLDGTLLDTIADLADACNYALEQHGLPVHPVEPYCYFVGNGVYKLIERTVPENRRDEETLAQVKADFDAYYSLHARDKTRPYPGIPEMLRALHDAGVKIGVLSNKPDGYAKELVRDYFDDLVDVTFGQREGVPIKPDPTAVHEIEALLGVKGGSGFYIGDTATDMETGKAAKLYTIGVLWGFRTKEELESVNPEAIIHKAEDLVQIILDKSE